MYTCTFPLFFFFFFLQLWSKVHHQPDGTSRWTTESMLASFDEFVGTCFDIAGLLDDAVSATAISTD